MEIWTSFIVSLCFAALLKSIHDHFFPKLNFPPGPPATPLIGNLLWLRRSFTDIETTLGNLHSKYGPITTLRIGSHPAIFISAGSLAHQALVQNGAIFSDRPKDFPAGRIICSDQMNISSCPYGPTWRILRRNLTEILHPSRVGSYSHARRWVLDILFSRLRNHYSKGLTSVRLMDHFQYAMFGLVIFMCVGDKLEETQIQEIEMIQRKLLSGFLRFSVFNLLPKFGKILFLKRWAEFSNLRKDQNAILLKCIRARQRLKQEEDNAVHVLSYVDTLLDLQLPEEKRKLNEEELVTLCSEFLNAGTDTTSTALEWIMANLVKYPHIQARVAEEMSGVVGEEEEEVKEEDLQKLPYLKAVVLEGLRRHPPGRFLVPHSVTQDVVLEGYHIPKKATVNFKITDMNWDPKIWEKPMEFNPERFLGNNMDGDGGKALDITGSREIKMMPFGAGRRICPGYGLAMLHLEYFVANLVWKFEWKAVVGDEVDLSEKQEFTTVMKNPLQVCFSRRRI